MNITYSEFVTSAVTISQLPEDSRMEFMFCGRSNVGKSSFINMLCNHHGLARTSSNPGKTQTLNIFDINHSLYFVDVPGYGYAKVSRSVKESFGKMIEEYVINSKNLKMVFLLVDYRHKPTEDDVLMYNFLKYYNHPVTVIATKSDKIKNCERAKCKKLILDTLNLQPGDKLIITSSTKREGIGQVLQTLDDVIAANTINETKEEE